MFENFALAFQGIWNHKLRSFLTMLGIIIGIASIITIVSTIKGTNDVIKQNLVGSGNNAVEIRLYQNDYPYDLAYSPNPEGVLEITEDTRKALEKLDGIKRASLFHSRDYANNIFYKNTAFSGSVLGIDSNYFDVYNYKVNYGRNFIEEDFADYRKVAILDSGAAESMFSGENSIGQTIEMNTETFTVVGVVSVKSNQNLKIDNLSDYYTYADVSGGKIFIPDSCWPIIYKYDEPQNVVVKANSTEAMTKAGKGAEELLTSTQITGINSQFSYRSEDLLSQAQELQELSSQTNKQLIWIAGISLLVGGIGVMNIMLVSVTERTSEIGLKKAIGARKRRILWQFLTEAIALTSLGGIIGVLVGIGLAYLLSYLSSTPTAVSVPAIIIAVVFSMVIGIIFGLIPAVKAARLNPIDALRHE